MHMVARIPRSNEELERELRRQRFEILPLWHDAFVTLPLLTKDPTYRQTIYSLPPALATAELFIDCAEFGGAFHSTGSATTVCGYWGNPLRPYFRGVPRRVQCGVQARFVINNHVVTADAKFNERTVHLLYHEIGHEDDTAWIITTPLWSGFPEDLVGEHSRYRAAAEAASAKANCFRCGDVHFWRPREVEVAA